MGAVSDISGDPGLELHEIDCDALGAFLESSARALMEIEVLRHVFGIDRMPADRRGLFAVHFSLYHALYRLKFEAGARGRYLHLDPMRIRLIAVPVTGCRWYSPEEGRFCGLSTTRYDRCALHAHPTGMPDETPSFDPLQEFYLNPGNIAFGESDVLERLMNGVVLYAVRRGEIEQALRLFDLSRPNRPSIDRRYHHLARVHHPDMPGGDAERMKEINRSYQVLKEVFVV